MKYEPDPEVIARLREYNRWRRGDEKIAQPDPGKIGRLLDTVCEMVGQLERERNEAREKYTALATENMLAVNKLAEERDEARAVAYDLAVIASHCLGWHDHESSEAAIRIAAALKRWKKSK